MPCYLFTYHAYGSWMPDRPQGFVRRGEGVLPSDEALGRQYRQNATEALVIFDSTIQRLAIDEAIIAGEKQDLRIHFVSTEPTHVHVLVSWNDDRDWKRLRGSVKSSLTRRFNKELDRREWFCEGGSRKRVKDRKHFDHLIHEYLRSHSGWKWSESEGSFR